jgi:hypothetical protein
LRCQNKIGEIKLNDTNETTKNETAKSSSEAIVMRLRQKAPGYKLRWNKNEIDINDDRIGMYELIGPDNKVHYRRSSLFDIDRLIGA